MCKREVTRFEERRSRIGRSAPAFTAEQQRLFAGGGVGGGSDKGCPFCVHFNGCLQSLHLGWMVMVVFVHGFNLESCRGQGFDQTRL